MINDKVVKDGPRNPFITLSLITITRRRVPVRCSHAPRTPSIPRDGFSVVSSTTCDLSGGRGQQHALLSSPRIIQRDCYHDDCLPTSAGSQRPDARDEPPLGPEVHLQHEQLVSIRMRFGRGDRADAEVEFEEVVN